MEGRLGISSSLFREVVKDTQQDVWTSQGTRVGGRRSSQCRGREIGVGLGYKKDSEDWRCRDGGQGGWVCTRHVELCGHGENASVSLFPNISDRYYRERCSEYFMYPLPRFNSKVLLLINISYSPSPDYFEAKYRHFI